MEVKDAHSGIIYKYNVLVTAKKLTFAPRKHGVLQLVKSAIRNFYFAVFVPNTHNEEVFPRRKDL